MNSESQIERAYKQLKEDPSLVFVTGELSGESGIFAWETYSGTRYPDKNNGQPVLILCFVPAKVAPLADNFHEYYVPATPDRVALVAFEPTRNITGGYADKSETLDIQYRKQQIDTWIEDLIR